MSDDDAHSTTTVLEKLAPGLAWLPKFLRQRLTPAIAWSSLTTLVVVVMWLANTLSDMRRLKESVSELQKERVLLQAISTNVAVLNNKVDSIAMEQREWREHIEREAESPPHSNHRNRH